MTAVDTVADLARVLRDLRRREARQRGGAELTYRELAFRTGWSRGIIGEYLAGHILPPTDRFDVLVRLLGATPAEQGMLATARDRVEEGRRTQAARAGRSVPRELPADVFGFTGRAGQLAELDALLSDAAPAAVVISALAGTAGVGKTALAVHWGHRVADRFPDGQLYVDLRGYGPGRPLSPDEALAAFLRSLGVDADLPGDQAERAARYRTLVAGRRMLVVLDNAYAADQVRPLLPGTPSSLVVVTSRDDLAGLVARDGARRIALDVLPPADAVALLKTLVGVRVDAEPAAAAALAERCARLPLALRVAAELAAARSDATLTDLLDEHRLLDLLGARGDRRTAVRAVFSWSHRHLGSPASRAFALLGLHPGRSFDTAAVAALAGTDTATGHELLDELAAAHLVQQAYPGRYTLHDLLRAYAVERAGADLDEADRRAAVTRLLDHYLHTAAGAMDGLFPYERASRPRLAGSRAVGVPDGWLDRELPNLIAAGTYAAEHGWPAHCADLSRTLFRFLEIRGRYGDALMLHAAAVKVSGGAGVLTNLGLTEERLGRPAEALEHLEEALATSRREGDWAAEARALGSLGAVYAGRGRYPDSLEHLQRALGICRETGDRHGEGSLLGNLGLLFDRLGRYAEAVEHQRQAADVLREAGDRRLEGYALGNLGAVYSYLGRYPEALDHLAQALDRCRESDDRAGIGYTLSDLGQVYRRTERYPEALDQLEQALAIGREIGNRSMEIDALNSLGETLRAMGQLDRALAHHRDAEEIARRTHNRRQLARALDGIGHVRHGVGSLAEAAEHWRQALKIYAELELPDAGRVRAQLEGVGC